MPGNLLKRIAPDVLEADLDAFRALKAIPDYQPSNPRYSLAAISAIHDRVRAAQDADVQGQNIASANRDALVLVLREYHEAILGMKDHVRAQYGVDSDELAAVGLKKKSERRTRGKPRKEPATPA